MNKTEFQTVDEYIGSFPHEIQQLLMQMRAVVKANAPDAQESVSYMMPAYKTYGKPLVYFGGMKTHIGFYATPNGNLAFAEQLKPYKQGKGSIQFPVNQPLPLELVAEMVRFRVEENDMKYRKKSKS
jgi:uncharacterized protein YdhG (YjbR/CyaY superfamily)